MEKSESIDTIATAIAAVRDKIVQPAKDADNPFFNSKYVPLESVVQTIDNALKDTGLTYTQSATSGSDNTITVYTQLMHKSGQYIFFDGLTLPAVKKNPQAFGSAVTYARRYALSTVFGIASDIDDDGNEATQASTKTSASAKSQAPRPISDVQRETLSTLLQQFSGKRKIESAEALTELSKFLKLKHSTIDGITVPEFTALVKVIKKDLNKK